jgi:hypothetical protein
MLAGRKYENKRRSQTTKKSTAGNTNLPAMQPKQVAYYYDLLHLFVGQRIYSRSTYVVQWLVAIVKLFPSQ